MIKLIKNSAEIFNSSESLRLPPSGNRRVSEISEILYLTANPGIREVRRATNETVTLIRASFAPICVRRAKDRLLLPPKRKRNSADYAGVIVANDTQRPNIYGEIHCEDAAGT